MPLKLGYSDKTIAKLKSNKPQAQAVAIALSVAAKAKKKAGKK